MAPHSSTLAWKIPWTEEPGRLQSMGSLESDTTEQLHMSLKSLLSLYVSNLYVFSQFVKETDLLLCNFSDHLNLDDCILMVSFNLFSVLLFSIDGNCKEMFSDMGFPCGLKESTCNVGDLGSIPGLGRCPGGGNSTTFQ